MARRSGHSRATIVDVAAAAGVSRQTVSNAVNAPERVSSRTLARVTAEIERLGFRPSRAARILKQQRAGAWGLELDSRGVGRLGAVLDEFLVLLTGLSRRHDSHIVPFVADDPADPCPAYDDLIASRIADGFVLTDTRRDDPRPVHLTRLGVPYAAFGRLWDDPSMTNWVDVDGAAGAERAVRHLVEQGYERIGYLGWPAGSPVGDERRDGWSRAGQELGVAHSEWDVEAHQDLGLAAAAAAPVIDAVGRGGALVCASDLLAVGAWEVLAERGWAIGRDFGVVGFDDTSLAESLRLTSLRQPLDEVAERVLDVLGTLPDQDPSAGVLLTPELVIRASSTPAGNRSTEEKHHMSMRPTRAAFALTLVTSGALALSACGGGGFSGGGNTATQNYEQRPGGKLTMMIGSSGPAETNAVNAATKAWATKTGNTVEVIAATGPRPAARPGLRLDEPARRLLHRRLARSAPSPRPATCSPTATRSRTPASSRRSSTPSPTTASSTARRRTPRRSRCRSTPSCGPRPG